MNEHLASAPITTSRSATRTRETWFDWTEERIEHLKKLWADGCSGSQIAARWAS